MAPILIVAFLIVIGVAVSVALVARQRLRASAAACAECGQPLSALDRVLGRTACATDRATNNKARDSLRARYLGALTGLEMTSEPTPRERQVLADTAVEDLGEAWHHQVAASALLYLIDEAVADNVLTADEDARIEGVAALVKLEPELAIRSRVGLAARLVIARANDGRLPRIREPSVRLRRREICYFQGPATLLSPAAEDAANLRPGVTIAKGARLDISVLDQDLPAIDRHIATWDSGMLVITEQRILFEGKHLNVQVPHRRLIGVTLFADAVQLRIAARKSQPVFRLEQPAVVAAVATSAWRDLGTASVPQVYSVAAFDDWPLRMAETSRSG